MKKYKNREMLEMVNTLMKANDSIGRNISRSMKSNIFEALSQCQELAILLGTYLETLGTTTQNLVHILEDYCEDIYQMSQRTYDTNLCRKLSKKIHKELMQVSDKIRNELSDGKKEVVFFPYNASMWDSLESIWKAAAEDENCNAYVVPIPYFDKNSDGSFGEMKYEGNEYPDYVTITSWNEYSMEEHRPDIAYIHNPYDGYNLVTSIHPHFYTKELKKHVDKLVYVPYFVGSDDYVEPSFCVMPGTMYSDVVIVQSEPVRQTYIKELKKFEIEHNCKGLFGNVEGKVLALGSPKYDKLLTLNVPVMEIPNEWEKIIVREDGTRKKVIIYNTSIHNMLGYGNKMISKISDTLKIFEKCKDDIALLWRPHPLIPTTLQAMRPDLWESYSTIVIQYKFSQWGIFDESSDMDRALMVSDAYYGDGGSLFELYKKTGKPYLVQNPECFSDSEDNWGQINSVATICMNKCMNKKKIIYSSIYGNSIYDLEDGMISVDVAEDDNKNSPMLFRDSIRKDDTIFFIPYASKMLLQYDLTTKIRKQIELPYDFKGATHNKFCKAFIYENKIIMLPGCAQMILCYDIQKEEFTKYDTWFQEYIQYIPKDISERSFFGISRHGSYVVNKNILLMPLLSVSKILRFDLETGDYRFLEIGGVQTSYIGIFNLGEKILLIPDKQQNIVIWNSNTEKIEKEMIVEGNPIEFGRSVLIKSYIVIFTEDSELILINITDFSIKRFSGIIGKTGHVKERITCVFKDENDIVYFWDTMECKLKKISVDVKGDVKLKIATVGGKWKNEKEFKKIFDKYEYLVEEGSDYLRTWLDELEQENICATPVRPMNRSIGKLIHKEMMN